MWCYVSQPNSVTFQVEIDHKADGQELLDKVCDQLGIIEEDYFGLQYLGSKGELLWLNMRNRITHQLPGSQPYHLQLRVKFFVQPHLLLQSTTRNQVYLHIKQDVLDGKLKIHDMNSAARISALIAQVEMGDHQVGMPSAHYKTIFGSAITSQELLHMLNQEHAQLVGVTRDSAQYRMLQEVSELPDFGIEYHKTRHCYSNKDVVIGVGPEGITLSDSDIPDVVERIEYPTIQVATHAGKNFYLSILDEDGELHDLGFKLVSSTAANSLYRCVTEKHSFYRCDTVRNAVSAQFSRDIKGTLASLFNENTSLGKKYMFDIRRTCREVYDHARRKLYVSGDRQRAACDGDCAGSSAISGESMDVSDDCDDGMCLVCMDAEIDTVFCPCGHIVCCTVCADKLSSCPMCRADIQLTQHVFLPGCMYVRRIDVNNDGHSETSEVLV